MSGTRASANGADAPWAVRWAEASDYPEVVRLRAVMFSSMDLPETVPTWREDAERVLRARHGDNSLLVAVVDAPDGVGLASTAVADLAREEPLPAPHRVTGLSAHVSSVSTDGPYRGRGAARAVLGFLLAELRRRGVERVELNATPDGEALYRSFGFDDRRGGRPLRLVWSRPTT